MMNFGAWNIKGLNSPLKQKEIKFFMAKNKLKLFVILETKMKKNNEERIRRSIFGDREFARNVDLNLRGRI